MSSFATNVSVGAGGAPDKVSDIWVDPTPGVVRNERGTQLQGMVDGKLAVFTSKPNDMDMLRRVLVLGSGSSKVMAGGKTKSLTKTDVASVYRLLDAGRGLEVVAELEKYMKEGRCPKMEPPVFILALLCRAQQDEVRAAAQELIPKVLGIPTHLFMFMGFLKEVDDSKKRFGLGRGLKRHICDWYLSRKPRQLAYQCTKFANREGMNHRDIMRLIHLKPTDPALATLLTYLVKGGEVLESNISGGDGTESRVEGSSWSLSSMASAVAGAVGLTRLSSGGDVCSTEPNRDELDVREFLTAVETAKKCLDEKEMVALIDRHGLAREHVPTELLGSVEVWRALLKTMPITAMIRNLGKMSSIGLLRDGSPETELVVKKLTDPLVLEKGKVHPIALLLAYKTYEQGKGDKGSLTWPVVRQVKQALDDAFYLSFKTVQPTGNRIVLGVDVSGSMEWSNIAGTNITPRVGAAAMSMLALRTETWVRPMAFSDTLVDMKLTPDMRLDQVIGHMKSIRMGATDCSLPMVWAKDNNIEVDTFIVYTDSDTNFGHISPRQALKNYNEKMGRNAQLIVVGMVSNDVTIADPESKNMLDVVGFDSGSPELMAMFMRREI